MTSLPHQVTGNKGKHIVVPPEVHRRLKTIAFHEDKTMCSVIAEFIENYELKEIRA